MFFIVLSSVASIFIFALYPKALFILGAILVIGAVFVYGVFPYKDSKRVQKQSVNGTNHATEQDGENGSEMITIKKNEAN